jgi:hypothetical protein
VTVATEIERLCHECTVQHTLERLQYPTNMTNVRKLHRHILIPHISVAARVHNVYCVPRPIRVPVDIFRSHDLCKANDGLSVSVQVSINERADSIRSDMKSADLALVGEPLTPLSGHLIVWGAQDVT